MLFNSYLFLFLFLPVTLAAHYLFASISPRLAAVWLCITSLVFYGWWNPQFVMLLIGSIAFNYAISQVILSTAHRPRLQLAVATIGVAADIALLIHYKYFVTLMNFAHEWGLAAVAWTTSSCRWASRSSPSPRSVSCSIAALASSRNAACSATCCSSPSSRT